MHPPFPAGRTLVDHNTDTHPPQIALFAATDLVIAEWGSVYNAAVCINGPWRVFEISSPDSNDESNYGAFIGP